MKSDIVTRRLADDPHWAVLVILVFSALAMRVMGIGVEGLSHPEIYIPGIDLAPNISEPPERHDVRFALWWHFHDEPHPIGWYMAMFGWTSLFGTSEVALRLPAAILGAASVPLVYVLARSAFGPRAAVLAMILLATHGFHIFWSQHARMYTAGVFLGLLSVWFLIQLAQAERRKPTLEVGYVLTCIAGVQTVEFFWPVLLMQVAWVSLVVAKPSTLTGAFLRPHLLGPRLLQLQSVALALCAPAILHAAYRARGGAALEPNLSFVTDYISFGFLMTLDDFRIPYLQLPPVLYWPIFGLALFLLVSATRQPTEERPEWREETPQAPPALPIWIAPLFALCVAGFMLWLASTATRRGSVLAVTALLPILALFVPLLGQIVRNMLEAVPPLSRWIGRLHPPVLLVWFMGVIAPLVIIAASMIVELLAERAFLIFVPFLLMILATGVERFLPLGLGRIAVLAALFVTFLGSIVYNERRLVSPNDYKGLAADMQPYMEPGDMIFLRMKDWVDTPFTYYMPDGNYVAEGYEQAMSEQPETRVWLVTWPYSDEPVIRDARRTALGSYEPGMVITALRASAELFTPPGTD